MAKNNKKVKKEKFIKRQKRIDGTTEVYFTKSPQRTLWGKIIITILAALLGLGSVVGLIFVLIQAI